MVKTNRKIRFEKVLLLLFKNIKINPVGMFAVQYNYNNISTEKSKTII